MASAPDYTNLFGNEMLSDLTIVLEEESNARMTQTTTNAVTRRNSKRHKVSDAEIGTQAANKSRRELPGHGAVLYGCSSFAKTKLENWKSSSSSSSSSSSQLEIQLQVPTGQLEVGELLVKGIYAAQPELTSCSQEQLVQLLLLADRYGVDKVLSAVTAAFSSMPTEQLRMETVKAVYSLPAGCADLDCCKGLYTAAGRKLQQELGDLELVFSNAEKRELLLGLPHGALLQLLQDPGTRVNIENTVFYAVNSWCEEQPAVVKYAELQLLVQLVRIKNCSPLYVATMLAPNKLASSCFEAHELAAACSYSALVHGSSSSKRLAKVLEESALHAKYPAWKADKRPASAVQQLDMQCVLPLQRLQQAVQAHLSDAEEKQVTIHRGAWQGHCMELVLVISRESAQIWLGLYLDVRRPEGGVAEVIFDAAFVAAGRHNAANTRYSIKQMAHVFSNANMCGNGHVVSLGALSSWSAAEAMLRELGLVHSDKCLHIEGQVMAIA